ncbi:helix-turn-helix domain-containing protein [Paenibacillus sp. SC116]|uniref:helix-turn-helix domain-containing protein n=1 Tax=Paenibacillus sp. SC116 TaxID=2968986 RepID=UPI00215A70DB|nr:helix-turn-helix domain-containing protein [Paenibacillus sp. SC116]MCR8844136.1 helix-turn-helix domain-containing protein [Paenibacillus sp. SC116]
MDVSFADMVRHYRTQLKWTMDILSEKSKVNKGTISKIENRDVKRPEYKTIKSLATALQIPYAEYIKAYIPLERNSEVILNILQEAITISDSSFLISDIATKYLELPHLDSYDAIEQLYFLANEVKDTSIQISLYKTIANYSRSHGVVFFLARSLLQMYYIERNDFTRLRETYQSGRYILNYTDIFNNRERLGFHYGLAVHAYTLRLYNDSVKLCELIINDNNSEGTGEKVHALCMFRCSNYYLGNYSVAEKCLIQSDKYTSPYTKDNDMLLRALLNAKKGNAELAHSQFEECLEKCAKSFIVFVVNEFLSFCLFQKDILKAENLIKTYEQKIDDLERNNPLRRTEYAFFRKLVLIFHG